MFTHVLTIHLSINPVTYCTMHETDHTGTGPWQHLQWEPTISISGFTLNCTPHHPPKELVRLLLPRKGHAR